MLHEKETQTSDEAEKLEMLDGSKEIIRLVSERKLQSWHGAIGWIVSASVVGGVSEIHISFAGKKLRWSGVLAGIDIGGQMSGMTGIIYCDPDQLMKHKWVTITGAKILGGTTTVDFWLSKDGVGFAGNLKGVGIGLGGGVSVGKGEWAYAS